MCRCPAFFYLALGCVPCVCISGLDVSVGALYIKRGKPFFIKTAPMCHASWTLQLGPIGQNTHKILYRVNCGNTSTKWGKTDEIPLNGVISVKNFKIGDKNRNSLLNLPCLYSLVGIGLSSLMCDWLCLDDSGKM